MPTSAQGSGQNEIYVDKASSILLLKYLSEFQEQMNRQNEQAQAEQHEARNDTNSIIRFNNLAFTFRAKAIICYRSGKWN
jgi:hypothetical protein